MTKSKLLKALNALAENKSKGAENDDLINEKLMNIVLKLCEKGYANHKQNGKYGMNYFLTEKGNRYAKGVIKDYAWDFFERTFSGNTKNKGYSEKEVELISSLHHYLGK